MTRAARSRTVTWMAIVLMVAAIAAYVLSLDDSDPQAVPDGIDQIEDTR